MSTPLKTLVILTPAFPGSELETVWVRPKQLFIRKLQESFPSLQIIILSFNYPFHTSEYKWRGIRVIAFNGMYTRKFRRLFLWIRVWRKLKEIKKQDRLAAREVPCNRLDALAAAIREQAADADSDRPQRARRRRPPS